MLTFLKNTNFYLLFVIKCFKYAYIAIGKREKTIDNFHVYI